MGNEEKEVDRNMKRKMKMKMKRKQTVAGLLVIPYQKTGGLAQHVGQYWKSVGKSSFNDELPLTDELHRK